nr:MAG TPA: hypothetical protein [Caudoviricetes sp.]
MSTYPSRLTVFSGDTANANQTVPPSRNLKISSELSRTIIIINTYNIKINLKISQVSTAFDKLCIL